MLSTFTSGVLWAQVSTSSHDESVAETTTTPSKSLKQHTFVPKGQWVVGGTVSFSQQNSQNYQFLVVEGIEGSGYSFNVSPMFSYMIANNMGIGARLGYERSLIKLNSASLNLSDDLNLSINDIYNLSHTYSAMAVLRNYISLGNSMRFALFNETQLSFSGGQSKLVSGTGNSVTGSYDTHYSLGVNLAPGITAFINNFMAVELNVGLLGFKYTTTHQVTDQVYEGKTTSTSASFQINLFPIGLGLAFYI